MSLTDRIVMGMTFDYVMIRKETIPHLIRAMDEFMKTHTTSTLIGVKDVLRQLEHEPDCQAVCFDQNSIAESFWTVWNQAGTRCHSYNIKRDKGHWYLFDVLPFDN